MIIIGMNLGVAVAYFFDTHLLPQMVLASHRSSILDLKTNWCSFSALSSTVVCLWGYLSTHEVLSSN